MIINYKKLDKCMDISIKIITRNAIPQHIPPPLLC